MPQPDYYKICNSDINPYSSLNLATSVFVLGSPGSGKSSFLKRIAVETRGTLVIESGVYAFFESCVRAYVERKRKEGYQGDLTELWDSDFKMPPIDGLDLSRCQRSSMLIDKTLDELAEIWYKPKEQMFKNYPYHGWGAHHYRAALGKRISSGGKSGYPDWLFIKTSDDDYAQVISFPGHYNISTAASNKSIPEIPDPDSVIFLVDPEMDKFDYVVTEKAPLHIKDVNYYEARGKKVHWYVSKTHPSQIKMAKSRIKKTYRWEIEKGINDFQEVLDRLPQLTGFDSLSSSRQEILAILSVAGIEL